MRRHFVRSFRMPVGLMAGALLPACILPLPIEQAYRHGSRENLSAVAREAFVAGKTTREEVLMSLGPPDVTALDESWMLYGSVRGKGGVLVFIYPSPAMPAFEAVEYTRLVIYFDEAGVVERTQLEKRSCQETTLIVQGAEAKPRPCVDVLGKDLPLVREQRVRD